MGAEKHGVVCFFWTDPAPPASRRSSTILPSIYRRLFVSPDNGHRSIVGRYLLSSGEQSAILSRKPFCSVRCLPSCYIALFVFAPGTHYEAGNATQHNPLARQSPTPFTLSITPPFASVHSYYTRYDFGLATRPENSTAKNISLK